MRTDARIKMGFALAALGAATFMCVHRYAPAAAGSHTKGAPSAPSSATETKRSWPATFTYRLQAGQAYSYDLKRETTVSRGGAPYATVTGEGKLVAEVVRSNASDADVIVAINFAGTAKALNAKPGEAQAKSAPINVSGSAHLRIEPNGHVAALRFQPDESAAEHTQLFANVLAMWLYPLPEAGEATVQGVEGQDGSGVFLAKHVADAGNDSPFAVTMRKQSYARASMLTRVVKSEHKLRWDLNEGHLLSARADEQLGKGPEDLKLEARDRSEVTFTGKSASHADATRLAAYSVAAHLYVAPASNPIARSQAAGGAPTQPWSQLQRELRDLPDDAESDKPMEVFTSLAASLEGDPSMLPSVLEETKAHGSTTKQFQMLIGAISQLGTPEAQQGLIDMYPAQDAAGKDMVLKGQVLLNEPATPETRKMLLDTYDTEPKPELKGIAGLALGNSLQNAGDDPTVEDVHARIMRMWSEAKGPNDQEYVLDVIGNSGDPYFLPLVSAVIQDATSLVRGRALAALRFMNTAESAQLLVLALQAKETPDLQLVATDALLYHAWQPELYEPLAACFLDKQSSDVRVGCAKVLLHQPSTQQQAQALLKQARDSGDGDEKVQELIRSQLVM